MTAEVPPFAKPGQRIDVNISTVGSAESLRGGNLILTELRGIDGQVYAFAQGSLTVTGVSADAAGSSIEIGVPTSGRIPNGAILERLIETPFETADHFVLNVRDADFRPLTQFLLRSTLDTVRAWQRQLTPSRSPFVRHLR